MEKSNPCFEKGHIFSPIVHIIIEPRSEKTGFLHMRKQRRRPASR